MDLCVFCLLLLSLQCVKGTATYYTLKPNVMVVVRERGLSMTQVPLLCGESYERDTIVWRIKGREVAQGNQVNVNVVMMQGGNYTCHAQSGALLNHTLVLVQAMDRRILDRSPDSDYLHCLSKNYSGVFQCSWRWSQTRKERAPDLFLVTASRSSVELTCTLGPSGQSITCRDHSHCPYSEERRRITLAVYVKNQFRVEKYTQAFYIADIVKPDRIPVTRLDTRSLEWGYPDTWSTPGSYFPLTFQVKEISRRHNCDCEGHGRRRCRMALHTTEGLQWPVRRGFLVCVRAQDALCNSTWSDWSLVRTNSTGAGGTKNNRKQKVKVNNRKGEKGL
ncbi:interleukin 12Ba [Conger conger]|uniref:interleukin 12Ba n=1 Tax=Conger conger TaxID=82655 RepID=UPI002A59EAE2|nr:interleukin 12Ba [Conger conger]